ncbi:MAG: sugar ABC transporter permease [Pleurocapsa sp. SU_196_0]|nr:sugar ABC transporter permease [Pleurocapsa sp. SU_196_0]
MNKSRNITLISYSFLLPTLVLMGVFTFYPVLYGAFLGFTDYTASSLAKGEGPRWVGFSNFVTIFNDPLFITGLVNSVKYLVVVPVLQLASLGVAVLVNRALPFMTFFRASYYVPVITSMSLAAVMWDWVYNRDGLLNWTLGALGLLQKSQFFGWLGNEHTALWAIMLVTFWRGFGYYMVLYLGGLQAIPAELEEAARLDGATPWQSFWRITVPIMRPTILLCSLLSTISALRVLEDILVFRPDGGPLNSTYTALMYVYQKALGGSSFDYGVASAAGLVVAVIGFGLSYLNFRLTREDAPRRKVNA